MRHAVRRGRSVAPSERPASLAPVDLHALPDADQAEAKPVAVPVASRSTPDLCRWDDPAHRRCTAADPVLAELGSALATLLTVIVWSVGLSGVDRSSRRCQRDGNQRSQPAATDEPENGHDSAGSAGWRQPVATLCAEMVEGVNGSSPLEGFAGFAGISMIVRSRTSLHVSASASPGLRLGTPRR